MDFAKISNYTIEIYFVLFYFGQRLYLRVCTKIHSTPGIQGIYTRKIEKIPTHQKFVEFCRRVSSNQVGIIRTMSLFRLTTFVRLVFNVLCFIVVLFS
jgi:hypothetical protein